MSVGVKLESGGNMVVYIDIVVLENLIMNYIILIITAVILRNNIKHIRLMIAATIGAIYAVITYTKIGNLIMNNYLIKVLVPIYMIYFSFKPRKIKEFSRQLGTFYIVSYVLAGVVISFINNKDSIEIFNGEMEQISKRYILIMMESISICFIIMYFGIKALRRKINIKDMRCDIEIYINEKKIKVKAIVDTGNMLKTPIYQENVIIIEKDTIIEIIPKEIIECLDCIEKGGIKEKNKKEFNKYINRIRLIPYSALGTKKGWITGIKVDKVIIDFEEKEVCRKDVVIGIYPFKLIKNSDCQALIGIELLS